MRRTTCFVLALASVFLFGNDTRSQSVNDIRNALKEGYERKFEVVGCTGTKDTCTINALALPVGDDGIDAICLNSVFPDVVYSRDGHGALGIEYSLSASTGDIGAYRFLGSFTAISVTETEGIQDFCVPRTLSIAGQKVAFSLDKKLPNTTQIRSRSSEMERGFRFALPKAAKKPRAPGQASEQERAALYDRFKSLPTNIVSSLLGETTTGIVWVSVWTAKPGQPVKIGRRQVGRTAIGRIGMPKSSLKKLTIGQNATRLLSKACQVFQYGIEYQFRC